MKEVDIEKIRLKVFLQPIDFLTVIVDSWMMFKYNFG